MLQGQHDGRVACCRWPAPPQSCGVITEDERDIDDPATSFGELLSCLRLAAGVSQSALGQEAGVHASYVHRLERGERATPTREVVLALSRSLGATPTERDRLLWLAGHLPVRLQQLGVGDATLATLVQFLTNDALPAEAKHGFRWCVEAMAALWGRDPTASGRAGTPQRHPELAVGRRTAVERDRCFGSLRCRCSIE
ncbi:MAG TPA: helix-turn-helix transcriptional regulator [Chloroflexota bacterium]